MCVLVWRQRKRNGFECGAMRKRYRLPDRTIDAFHTIPNLRNENKKKTHGIREQL